MICPQTGLALAGLKTAVQNGQIAKGSRVVVVATAHGLKFTHNFLPKNAEDVGEILSDATTSAAAKAIGL